MFDSLSSLRLSGLYCTPAQASPPQPAQSAAPEASMHALYLSSGSSFSSFMGVILTPPFLARGHPDKLKDTTKKHQARHLVSALLLARWFPPPGGHRPTFCGRHSFQSRALSHRSLGLDTWETQSRAQARG